MEKIKVGVIFGGQSTEHDVSVVSGSSVIKNLNKEKYEIIGLTFNDITEQQLYDYIKKYDTEDDWTYWCNDEELKGNVRYFIDRNKYFNKMFKKYKIKTFDTSYDREKVLNSIIDNLDDLENK